MKPVDQTIFRAKDGNCFAACVASIFELSLSDVPNFCSEDHWPDNFVQWLYKRGLCAIEMDVTRGDRLWFHMEDEKPLPVHTIISGPSPRLACHHCVVYFGHTMVHDPHPSREGLMSSKECYVMYFIDPMLGSDKVGK